MCCSSAAQQQTMVGNSWAEAGRMRGLTFFLWSLTDNVFIRRQRKGRHWNRHRDGEAACFSLLFAQRNWDMVSPRLCCNSLTHQEVTTCYSLWSPSTLETRGLIIWKRQEQQTHTDSLKLILPITQQACNYCCGEEEVPTGTGSVSSTSVVERVWLQ